MSAVWATALAATLASGGSWSDAAASLCRWDCPLYLEIAVNGYDRAPGRWDSGLGANWAFFPALPLAVRAVMTTTGLGPLAAGLALAQAASFASLLLFLLYARDLCGERFARFATALFAVAPFSVYLSVPMSEALFVPLTLAALLAARRDRWLLAGVTAAALSATRPVGVLIVPALLLIAAHRHGLFRLVTIRPGTERVVAGCLLGGLGLAGFMAHLHATMGDALAFSHVQIAWGRTFTSPIETVLVAANPFDRTMDWSIYGYQLYNLAIGATAGVLALVLARMRLVAEAVFAGAGLMLALSTGQTIGLPRYAGGTAPLALALARLVDRPGLRTIALALSGAGFLAVTAAWCRQSLLAM